MYRAPVRWARLRTATILAAIIALVASVATGCISRFELPEPPPGSPDAGFGPSGTGIATLEIVDEGSEEDKYVARAKALAVQPDGKIILAGTALGWFTDIAVARFEADGSLDASFGTGGVFRYEIVFDGFDIADIALQGDGKIVLAGYRGSRSENFMIVRLTSDGALDPDFGGGIVLTTIGGRTRNSRASSVSVYESSPGEYKIVAAGWAAPSVTHRDLAVARYNGDGSLDTSFNGIGYATTDIATGSQDEVLDIAVLSDGSIVAAGKSASAALLARFTAGGILDTSFGSGGIALLSPGSGDNRAHSIAIRPDRTILAACRADGDDRLFIASFDPLGAPDTEFGTEGIASTTFEGVNEEDGDIALQDDGKLVYAGHAGIDGNQDFVIARYGASGDLDADFGTGGIVSTAIGDADDAACAVAVQPDDGKILAAGRSYVDSGFEVFAIARYNP